MARGQAALAEQLLEGGDGGVFAGGFQRFAQQQEARGVVGDGQRIAVLAVAELELALEVGAPQIVGSERRRTAACRWRGGAAGRCALTRPWRCEHGVDGALGRDADVAGQAAHQQLADLARAPVRLLALERDDQALDLARAAGWHSAPAGASGRSAPRARAPCSGRRSCSRSCGRCRTPGRARSSPRRRADVATNRRRSSITEHSFHGIDTSRSERRKVLPMCPVRSVTYVSGRSQ